MTNKQINILLVEDNPGDVRLVREMLLEANDSSLVLSQAGSLSDANEHMEHNHVDVMLGH